MLLIDIQAVLDIIQDTKNELSDLNTQVLPINMRIHDLIIKRDRYTKVLEALRTICDHDMQDDGTTSHGHEQWETCSKCGLSTTIMY